ncbi:MAG: hypothetical protein LKI25_01300 [Atopobiaceae bacterium]|jgi:hypothetical protein|nr:hypothetical protein [Atopobiaceae bacterium]MCI2172849.1 hypothetical protein [Atopobiaceae bacterium]MCI2207156.1 hypothetical protein [Atopobiaceae bacterium]
MADETNPLSDDERAELEALRAEKAAKAKAAAEAAERSELEALRAEKATGEAQAEQAAADRATDEAIAERRERNRKLVEPDVDDDDIKMPIAQKVILVLVAFIMVAVVYYLVRGA